MEQLFTLILVINIFNGLVTHGNAQAEVQCGPTIMCSPFLNLFCDKTTGTCKKQAHEGETCTQFGGCMSRSFCDMLCEDETSQTACKGVCSIRTDAARLYSPKLIESLKAAKGTTAVGSTPSGVAQVPLLQQQVKTLAEMLVQCNSGIAPLIPAPGALQQQLPSVQISPKISSDQQASFTPTTAGATFGQSPPSSPPNQTPAGASTNPTPGASNPVNLTPAASPTSTATAPSSTPAASAPQCRSRVYIDVKNGNGDKEVFAKIIQATEKVTKININNEDYNKILERVKEALKKRK